MTLMTFDWDEHPACPHCGKKGTYKFPRRDGDAPGMRLCMCDGCKIGWWQPTDKRTPGKIKWTNQAWDQAQKLYVPRQEEKRGQGR